MSYFDANQAIIDLIKKYENARNAKDAAKDALDAAKAGLRKAEEDLADAMFEADVTQMGYNGMNYTPRIKTEWSFKNQGDLAMVLGEQGEESKFSAFRNHGLGFLVSEQINQRSLTSYINNTLAQEDGEVPDEIIALLNPYDHGVIGRNKQTAKQKANAAQGKAAAQRRKRK